MVFRALGGVRKSKRFPRKAVNYQREMPGKDAFNSLRSFGSNVMKTSFPKPIDFRKPIGEENKQDFRTVWNIIKERRDIRKYQLRDVSDNLILDIIEAGAFAHSEGNSQPWEFIIIRNPQMKKAIVETCYNQMWMLEAPVLIVACINMRLASAIYGERGEKLLGIQGVAAAMQNMLLAAETLGLGSCWVGSFIESRISILTKCPEYVRPCAVITIGWPAEKPPQPILQNLKELIHIENFGETILYKDVLEKRAYPSV